MSNKRDNQYVGKHYVYRLFDKHGELVYIGMTQDVNGRMQHHTSDFINPWARHVESVTSEENPTRTEARAAEQAAIAAECPPFNRYHNPRATESRADYLERWESKREPADPELAAELNRMFAPSP